MSETGPNRDGYVSSLLAIDIGNTNTVLGLWSGDDLVAHYRIETNEARTSDELAVLLRGLLSGDDIDVRVVGEAIVSTVVPTALHQVSQLCERRLRIPLVVVGPGIKTGMPILYENPREVGADRIVNAVAAYEKLRAGCIVVDFGTATTWDVVSPRGEYLGGIIAPGVQISAEALYRHAAKLPRVELARPGKVVGRNTVASMQSGLVYGYAGMVDAMVDRIRAEVEFEARCLATGGLAPLIAGESRTIEAADDLLTLRGLKILFDRNRSAS
ncbi:MAG TPA: type III pantothenate kinase [Kofleriaceae bacterium]|nr:type III pantothenate kinase [Kofleriaceae bacterium]